MMVAVDGAPVGAVRHGEEIDGAVDVVEEIVLAEEVAEVCLLGEEVGRGVGELDRHVFEDGTSRMTAAEGPAKRLELPGREEAKGLEGRSWRSRPW